MLEMMHRETSLKQFLMPGDWVRRPKPENQMNKNQRTEYFKYITPHFFSYLPSSGIASCVGTAGTVLYMTPTLDSALLCSSRVGSDLGRKSDRFEELYYPFINLLSTYCFLQNKPFINLLFLTKQTIYQPIVSNMWPCGYIWYYGFLLIWCYSEIFGPLFFVRSSGFGLLTHPAFI